MGIGTGLSFISVNSFTTYNENTLEKTETSIEIPMSDKLVIDDLINIPDDKIVIDNDLSNIKLDITTYGKGKPIYHSHMTYDRHDDAYNAYEIAYIYVDNDELEIFKQIVNDLKHKRINTFDGYDREYEINKVYISNNNLEKIKENYHKLED